MCVHVRDVARRNVRVSRCVLGFEAQWHDTRLCLLVLEYVKPSLDTRNYNVEMSVVTNLNCQRRTTRLELSV